MTRLKELRKAHNETQSEISAIIGITRAAYSNIETGKREPDFSTLGILADHYGVSVDYLLGRDGKKSAIPEDDGLRERLAMFEGLSPEAQEQALDYMRYLAEKEAYEK